jgi:NTE family protein
MDRAGSALAPHRLALERRGGAGTSRVAVVLGAGGSRGAYEAGVLAYLFEEIYPELPPGFEFDIVSGTSVGALHAAYLAATAHEPASLRASRLLSSWSQLRLSDVLRARDLVAFPLRALGMLRVSAELAALERVVRESIPWGHIAHNLAAGSPGVLCVPCTHVGSGQTTLFLDGALADTTPWHGDAHVRAEIGRIEEPHVRASGAIPFLFPPVQIGDSFYVDGGLRLGTPVSPAVRLGADRVLVITPGHAPGPASSEYEGAALTQPAFLLGKVVNAIGGDQLACELDRIRLVNAWIERGQEVFGVDFASRMNLAQSGAGPRHVDVVTLSPSQDLSAVAWRCQRRQGLESVASLFARVAVRGVPDGEADLLSYLYFDGCFTRELVELGRADAERAHDQILSLLGGACAVAA